VQHRLNKTEIKQFYFSRATFDVKHRNKNAETAVKRFISVLLQLCGRHCMPLCRLESSRINQNY